MTKEEALNNLDTLDQYWNESRRVRQMIPSIQFGDECGCFGAHCARALGLRVDGYCVFTFENGIAKLEEIAKGLGLDNSDLHQIIQERSGIYSGPFGPVEWINHPNQSWPKISEQLRGLAS